MLGDPFSPAGSPICSRATSSIDLEKDKGSLYITRLFRTLDELGITVTLLYQSSDDEASDRKLDLYLHDRRIGEQLRDTRATHRVSIEWDAKHRGDAARCARHLRVSCSIWKSAFTAAAMLSGICADCA